MTAHGHETGRPAHTPATSIDDDHRWMARLLQLEDHEVDALLAGEPSVDPELAPISDLARALRSRVAREPLPPLGQALRDQLAAGPARGTPRGTRRSLLAAAAAVVVAGLAAVTVGAAQNRVPADLQDAVASTAELVGIDVPTSEERPAAATPGDERRDAGATHGQDDGAPGDPPTQDGDVSSEDATTPGGATPADPGVPKDAEPATPAVPPDPPAAGTVPDAPGPPQDPSSGDDARGDERNTPPAPAPTATGGLTTAQR